MVCVLCVIWDIDDPCLWEERGFGWANGLSCVTNERKVCEGVETLFTSFFPVEEVVLGGLRR